MNTVIENIAQGFIIFNLIGGCALLLIGTFGGRYFEPFDVFE